MRPDDTSCQNDRPVYCAGHPGDTRCQGTPEYCALKPQDSKCTDRPGAGEPGFCQRNPDDSVCARLPEFCQRNPYDTSCQNTRDFCTLQPWDTSCRDTPFGCQNNPDAPGCQVPPGRCRRDPTLAGCPRATEPVTGCRGANPPPRCKAPPVTGCRGANPPPRCETPRVCAEPKVLVGGKCQAPPPVCARPKVLVGGKCQAPPPACTKPDVVTGGVCGPPVPYTSCDPFSGRQTTGSDVNDYLSREDPTPNRTRGGRSIAADGAGRAPGAYANPRYRGSTTRDDVLGSIWTPACEPTNTTGDGSCITNEFIQESSLSAEVEVPCTRGVASLKYAHVVVVLRQTKNNGQTDFLVFAMDLPQFLVKTVQKGGNVGQAIEAERKKKSTADFSALYVHAKVMLYRTNDDPTAPGEPSTNEIQAKMNALTTQAGYANFTDHYSVGGLDPFLGGTFYGQGVSAAYQSYVKSKSWGPGLELGGQTWGVQDGYVDTDLANPDNFGVTHGRSTNLSTRDATVLPLDIVKLQPMGGGLTGSLGQQLPGPFKGCKLNDSTWDQLDMAVASDSDGKPQTATLEGVVRFAGANCEAALSRAFPGKVKVKAGGYLAIRYTARVDLAGRTPESADDLGRVCAMLNFAPLTRQGKKDASESWQDAHCDAAIGAYQRRHGPGSGHADLTTVPGLLVDTFGPQRNSSFFLYGGGGVTAGGETPGTTSPVTVGGEYTVRDHQIISAYYNDPHNASQASRPTGSSGRRA